MASTEPEINKLGAAGKTRDTTLTIPETLEIIRKLELLHARGYLWQHKTLDF